MNKNINFAILERKCLPVIKTTRSKTAPFSVKTAQKYTLYLLKRPLQSVSLMLWSQIKLTSYDFTDLHITGEFDNRPGTERFLRIFSCMVTYRTGAGRRLYMKTSADARPGTVRR